MSEKNSNDCPLCVAVSDANGALCKDYNTPLYETSRFLVTPCIGPLVAGHVLITSKDHAESLASMTAEVVKELNEIFDVISKKGEYIDCLITEHGSLDDQMGGACIVHCHLHVIPLMGSLFNALDSILPFRVDVDLESVFGINYPYIFCMNFSKGFRIYEAYNAYSQMMRKAICSSLNRDDHDWKVSHSHGLTQKTLLIWKS